MRAYYLMAVTSSIWVAVSLTVSACALLPTAYLKPSATGGEYTKSGCAGVAGPEDRLVLAGPDSIMIGVESFSLEEVRAVLGAVRPPKTSVDEKVGTGFSVILHIPVGQTVRFASRSFFLTDQVTHAVHEYQATSVLDFAQARVLLDGVVAAMQSGDGPPKVRQVDMRATLTGVSQPDWHITPRWFGRVLDHPYYVIVPFDGVTCRDCRLRLPPLAIDSLTFEFPEIRFKLVKEWVLWPLNC
jgi:hypothetical protein